MGKKRCPDDVDDPYQLRVSVFMNRNATAPKWPGVPKLMRAAEDDGEHEVKANVPGTTGWDGKPAISFSPVMGVFRLTDLRYASRALCVIASRTLSVSASTMRRSWRPASSIPRLSISDL
jgi:hypothetical protein